MSNTKIIFETVISIASELAQKNGEDFYTTPRQQVYIILAKQKINNTSI